MKITISKNKLMAALSKVQGAVGSVHTMPILSSVLIKAEDGYLKLTTTNLEVSIIEEIEAETVVEGSICLPAKKLLDIVKEAPGAEVAISKAKNHWVEISSGKARFKMVGFDMDDFPRIPLVDETETVEVKASVLSSMIDKVIVSVSTDQSRYNLGGVYVEHVSDVGIKLVSTDGHRLAVVVHGSPVKEEKRGHIVPRGGIQEFRKVLDGADNVEMGFKGNHAVLRAGDTVVISRFIEGEFPDYEQVIPEYSGPSISINRKEAISIVKRVAILSDDKTRAIRLELKSGVMMLSTTNPGLGDATEEAQVEYAGEAITLGFNAKYLLEFMTVMTGETLILSAKGDQDPILLQCDKDPESIAIVMPMRV
jgi:DNA polymerase-3 subunit beta